MWVRRWNGIGWWILRLEFISLQSTKRKANQIKKKIIMVMNSLIVITVARVSAEAWQWLACIGEPVSSDELLDLLCCFPFHQLGRLLLCLCSFFCLHHPDGSFLPSSDDDDDDSSSTTLDFDGFYYHSHSDWFYLLLSSNFSSLLNLLFWFKVFYFECLNELGWFGFRVLFDGS